MKKQKEKFQVCLYCKYFGFYEDMPDSVDYGYCEILPGRTNRGKRVFILESCIFYKASKRLGAYICSHSKEFPRTGVRNNKQY